MNERIQELAKQANIRFVNDYQLSGKPRDEWRSVPDMFAELIVRECAELNFRELGLSGSASFDVSRMIKQHFGVSE